MGNICGNNSEDTTFVKEEETKTIQQFIDFRGGPTNCYDNIELKWNSDEEYEINYGKFLGKGAFGKVFLGRHKQTDIQYAIKVIEPEPYVKKHLNTKREVLMLQSVCGGPNIIKLVDIIQNVDSLSDGTEIAGTTWKDLKEAAMDNKF